MSEVAAEALSVESRSGTVEPTEYCDENGFNDSFLLCQRCDSIVLRPGLAKRVTEKEVRFV